MTATFAKRAAAVVLICWLLGCASHRSLCDRIAAATDDRDPQIRRAINEVLTSVAASGQVEDPCLTEASIEVAGRLRLRENIPVLRRIAVLDYTAGEPGLEQRTREDTVSLALHTLLILNDTDVIALARRHLSAPVSIAGAAVSTLQATHDWTSTAAVADRLAGDDDPRRHYALVWLGLEFLAESPQQPPSACAVLRRLHAFDSATSMELRDPLIAKIGALRQSLGQRYACAE